MPAVSVPIVMQNKGVVNLVNMSVVAEAKNDLTQRLLDAMVPVVSGYLDRVWDVAKRKTGGNEHKAEDVFSGILAQEWTSKQEEEALLEIIESVQSFDVMMNCIWLCNTAVLSCLKVRGPNDSDVLRVQKPASRRFVATVYRLVFDQLATHSHLFRLQNNKEDFAVNQEVIADKIERCIHRAIHQCLPIQSVLVDSGISDMVTSDTFVTEKRDVPYEQRCAPEPEPSPVSFQPRQPPPSIVAPPRRGGPPPSSSKQRHPPAVAAPLPPLHRAPPPPVESSRRWADEDDDRQSTVAPVSSVKNVVIRKPDPQPSTSAAAAPSPAAPPSAAAPADDDDDDDF